MESIERTLERVSKERLARDIHYLAADPLPCRRLNYARPGRGECTLYEADAYIREALRSAGYAPEDEPVRVQAFRRDASKPLAHQYSRPAPEDPWYTAYNIYGKKTGAERPEEVIVVAAHKDSQSWMDCGPGAYDNAVGTAAVMELARALAPQTTRRCVWFLFCNEEHTPWTSATAAKRLAASPLTTIAMLNVDSVGGKSQETIDRGALTSVARYSTPEGEALADLAAFLNNSLALGLEHKKHFCEKPNDDDGSFVKAGIAPAILLVGSFPYADPNYHTEDDTPDAVDIENVHRAAQLALAMVMTLDSEGAVR